MYTDSAVIYHKRFGVPPVPVTVRADWLPDGVIAPAMYWTPDGTRFDVTNIYEVVQLVFLRDNGTGVRFKIDSRVFEPDEELRGGMTSYLYFEDDRFCGKNFIDGRYAHDGKLFISVTLDIFPDGAYEPVYFTAKGERYIVEKTLLIEPRASLNAGGVGLCHTVKARLVNACDDRDPNPDMPVIRRFELYWEVNKWFISAKDGIM